MVQSITEFLSGYFSPGMAVFVISMLPIAELRGGLIAASILGIPWQSATIISIIGNLLPIPFILIFVKRILAWLKGTRAFRKLAQKYETRALTKGEEIIQKYPGKIQLALFLFVAIPLPMTGAWTGALVAAFLDLPLKRSLPAIAAGVCGAAVIMLILAYLAPSMLGFK